MLSWRRRRGRRSLCLHDDQEKEGPAETLTRGHGGAELVKVAEAATKGFPRRL